MDFQLSKEQKQIVASLDDVGKNVFAQKAARWDENHEYPWENIHQLREMGVLGMTFPRAYGGQESPLIDAVLAIETTAKYCGVTARAIVETNIGAVGCVMAYGTDAQRKLVAHRVLQEGDKPAIGMTEPEAGTALTDLATTAEKIGDDYVINGTKHWITGGGVSRSNSSSQAAIRNTFLSTVAMRSRRQCSKACPISLSRRSDSSQVPRTNLSANSRASPEAGRSSQKSGNRSCGDPPDRSIWKRSWSAYSRPRLR